MARFAVAISLAWDASLAPVHREGAVCTLRGTVRSLRATGWDGPVVCLIGGAAVNATAPAFRACSDVVRLPTLPRYDAGPADIAGNTSRTIRWYRAAGRLPPPAYGRQQPRRDGALTSVKFAAWGLAYDLVLHTDADVLFLESPRAALEAAHARRLLFQAAKVERAGRGYDGLNTHMMLLKPSPDVQAILLANAAAGHFVPYTRTEQDVLEAAFPFYVASAGPAAASPTVPMPAHLHYFKHGCSKQFCCGSSVGRRQDWLRVPRRACPVGRHSAQIVGRVRGFRTCEARGCAAAGGGSHGRVLGSRREGRPTREAPAPPSALGSLVYSIEYLTAEPLEQRRATSAAAAELCGGARELLERCHALKWRGPVRDSAEATVDPRLAANYQGGERLGCGTEF